jgi:hypothetical protein
MLKSKLIILGVLVLLALSSCGIFHKGCDCPKFGEVKTGEKFENVKIC